MYADQILIKLFTFVKIFFSICQYFSIILPPKSAPFDVMVVLEVAGPEGSTDQISFSVLQPEFELIKVNFYIGKLVRNNEFPSKKKKIKFN